MAALIAILLSARARTNAFAFTAAAVAASAAVVGITAATTGRVPRTRAVPPTPPS